MRRRGGRCSARDADGRRIRIPIGLWPRWTFEGGARPGAATEAGKWNGRLRRKAGQGDHSALLDLYDKRRLVQLRKGRVIRRALDAALKCAIAKRAATRRDISGGRATTSIARRFANRMLAYAPRRSSDGRWGAANTNPAAGISSRRAVRDTLSEIAEMAGSRGLGYPFEPVWSSCPRPQPGAMRSAACASVDLAGDRAELARPCHRRSRSKNDAIRTPRKRDRNPRQGGRAQAGGQAVLLDHRHGRPSAVAGQNRIDKAIDEARRKAGVTEPMEHWRFDLRRSFATHACDLLQIDLEWRPECLHHVEASCHDHLGVSGSTPATKCSAGRP